MNLLELETLLQRAREGGARDDLEVRVVVRREFSIGSTPSVGVRAAAAGFDWDNGKFLIWTDVPVKQV